MNMKSFGLLVFLLGILALSACEEEQGQVADPDADSDTDTDTDTDTDADGDTDDDSDTNPTENCGDGHLTPDEECDDGNLEDGDGCAGTCRYVEPGYSCPPGEPCVLLAICGDGLTVFPEICDDGNKDDGDGCSDLCKIEIGFKCTAPPDAASRCVPTVCGDGFIEGAEGCDDNNSIPFDGCSADCQMEPNCDGIDGSCTSDCGDGLVLGNEECDDGNNLDGDGCSSACIEEEGYDCVQEGCVDAANCVLRVAAVVRDFTGAHPDFGVACDGMVSGMVESTLSSTWKPVQTTIASSACATAIGDWYSTAHTPTSTVVGELLLYPDGFGNYVNRWGANGEKYKGIYDGNPLFFPVDHLGTDLGQAGIPPSYGGNWESEVPAVFHNFYFTTEVTYWFAYDENNVATLNFEGDDDVWVFVNGVLAVDLGGVHIPAPGAVMISSTTAPMYGLTHGNVYRINIFHAERKMTGSTFKLTLGDFNTARSECRAQCGDGVVGIGEECDDGVNDGGYGECAAGCVYGEYCGDGIVQEEETCDDGDPIGGECPASCREIEIE